MLINQFNYLRAAHLQEEIDDGIKAYCDRGVPSRAIKIRFTKDEVGVKYQLYVETQEVPPSLRAQLPRITEGLPVVQDYVDPNARWQRELTPRRVMFPTFEIQDTPEIPLTQIRERRFDLIERAQEMARQQITQTEDERFMSIVMANSSLPQDEGPRGQPYPWERTAQQQTDHDTQPYELLTAMENPVQEPNQVMRVRYQDALRYLNLDRPVAYSMGCTIQEPEEDDS